MIASKYWISLSSRHEVSLSPWSVGQTAFGNQSHDENLFFRSWSDLREIWLFGNNNKSLQERIEHIMKQQASPSSPTEKSDESRWFSEWRQESSNSIILMANDNIMIQVGTVQTTINENRVVWMSPSFLLPKVCNRIVEGGHIIRVEWRLSFCGHWSNIAIQMLPRMTITILLLSPSYSCRLEWTFQTAPFQSMNGRVSPLLLTPILASFPMFLFLLHSPHLFCSPRREI